MSQILYESLKLTSYKLNSQAVNMQQVMQPCKIFLVHAGRQA